MSELKIGVIGSGGRGKLARHAHAPEAGSRVVACCDVYEKTLAENRESYGDDIYTTNDFRELLQKDLDGVMICSPDWMHEEQALAAIEAGIPIYLEKPMAITIEGCDKILTASRAKGVKVFVGHNMRYMGIIHRMKTLIEQGAIGEVKSVWCRHFVSYGGDAYFRDWHAEREKSTGLLLQKGAHDIDVMHWLAGKFTTRVSAFGNNVVYGQLPRREEEETRFQCAPNDITHWPPMAQSGFNPVIDVEDQNVVIMQMEDGVLGSYLQCHFTPDSARLYTVIGTEGRLENYGDNPADPVFVWNKRTDTFNLIGNEVYRSEAEAAGGHGGADPVIVGEWLDFLRGTVTETRTTPEASRQSVATGCKATESLRNGGIPLEIPALP